MCKWAVPDRVCSGHHSYAPKHLLKTVFPPTILPSSLFPLTQRFWVEKKQISSCRRTTTYALPLSLAYFNLSLMFFHCGTCLTANASCLDSCVSLRIQCPHLWGTFLANICPECYWWVCGEAWSTACEHDVTERCRYTAGFTEAV